MGVLELQLGEPQFWRKPEQCPTGGKWVEFLWRWGMGSSCRFKRIVYQQFELEEHLLHTCNWLIKHISYVTRERYIFFSPEKSSS